MEFPKDDQVCLLLTGNNNEGKSSLLFALQLLRAAARVVNKPRQQIEVAGDSYYRLLRQDVGTYRVGRLIHNYNDSLATIRATFSDNVELSVFLDPQKDEMYADIKGRIPHDVHTLLGFVPPLGRLAENEERLSMAHLKESIETTLAPRHFRNHLDQILSPDELVLVQRIIRESWDNVELLHTEYNIDDNRLTCFYREGSFDREVSWAGQGLQIWFQIVTHLVRLRNTSVLVLDEPEINLHPQKQNELVRLLREHHSGSVIIATHSVELMNNVGVSHIVHVQKRHSSPRVKRTSDRAQLEVIRSRIGSNFNLIASQFEAVDTVLFTEDQSDFSIIRNLSNALGVRHGLFNIPLHGFSEYVKAKHYKDAYNLLLGGNTTQFTAVLDRDYYPDTYLAKVEADLQTAGIKAVFTPGKEIENLFLEPPLLQNLFEDDPEWPEFWDCLFEDLYLDALGSWVQLHENFGGLGKGKRVLTTTKPVFDARWKDTERRYLMLPGKDALSRIRDRYRNHAKENLSQAALISDLADVASTSLRKWLREIVVR